MAEWKVCKIALVTEELAFGKGGGGIGGAFHELGLALRRAGHVVDLIYLPVDPVIKPCDALVAYYADRGIRVVDPEIERFVWPPFSYERRSYALFRYLVSLEDRYDFIHFHDYKGLGFSSLAAKSQHLGFSNTTIIVQVHGPTRWTLEANDHPFTHPDQLKVDYMERESIARADLLVSPSRYMINWLKQNNWVMPAAERVRVIQNVCSHLSGILGPSMGKSAPGPCNEIVFFGRHEDRKGIAVFCDALNSIRDHLADANILVTFLGGFGIVDGQASALYLARRSCGWTFPLRLLPDYDRVAASRYLASNRHSVVVIPSPVENSPYTVLEAAIAGKPLITSADGGSVELLDPILAASLTCAMDRNTLSLKLVEAVRSGIKPARLAVAPEETEREWLGLHVVPPKIASVRNAKKKSVPSTPGAPKVVAAITHYERPTKLYDAVMSLAAQLYPHLEIVVVDDGSSETVSLQLLERLTPLFAKLNVRLLHQPNRYLGAARNHAIAETESDYILFLDDDDIAFPNLVQTLVTAAEATGADIVNCLNLYMPESRRAEAHPFPERFQQKASYVPLGGPLSLAPLENCYGGATSLIRRNAAVLIGGYTEVYGVGHEDYELYVRALQADLRIEVCPLPLYLYEVDHSGMIANTSRYRNWNRVARAIDLSKNLSANRDLVSLTTGRMAREHIDNYRAYRMTNDPQASLLARMAHEPVDGANYATLVAEYATVFGAVTYVNALRALTTARSSGSTGPDALFMPALEAGPGRPIARQPEIDAVMLGALIDLSLDRVEQATDAFMLTWEREPGSLSIVQRRFLQALARHDKLTSSDADRIIRLLKRKSFELDEMKALVPVMFCLALRAHDMQTAVNVVDRALIIDERLYLSDDESIEDLISNGTFVSALDHFIRAGESQDKRGFELLRGIKTDLYAQVSVDVPLTSLCQYVRSLAQGQAADAGLTSLNIRGNGAQPLSALARSSHVNLKH